VNDIPNQEFASRALPERPRLRPVDAQRITRNGEGYLVVSDPRHMADDALLVPEELAAYLALADGGRTLGEIAGSGMLRGAPPVRAETLEQLFGHLDSLFLIENGAYQQERARRLEAYRSAKHRPPALAGGVYATRPGALEKQLAGYSDGNRMKGPRPGGRLTAILSPHIDYARGGKSYATVWGEAAPDLQDVELAVIFGTDHNGDGPRLTLTRQSYATPWGPLPTDTRLVDELAEALGADPALPEHPFADEFNHIGEHSVELVAVWLHYAAGRPVAVLPVLCGSLHRYVSPDGRSGSPTDVSHISDAIGIIRKAAGKRRTVFIAAADLAHVGPAFGDSAPASQADRARVQSADEGLLDSFVRGDGAGFLRQVREAGDVNRICGLAPAYMALWAAGEGTGRWSAYSQCPADDEDRSFVSIAGSLLYQ